MEENKLNYENFTKLFPNTRFRYIHDVDGTTIQGNDELDLSWNKKGYGIFFTVNGFPSTGKADQSQLMSLNGNYTDFDVDAQLPEEEKDRLIQETLMSGIEEGIPTPTIINRTKNGAHFIWIYPEEIKPTTENIEKWRKVQKRIVYWMHGDKNPIDPSRVLRFPYTLHLKNPENPFEVTTISFRPKERYTLEELDSVIPEYKDEAPNEKIPAIELLLKGVPVGEGLRHKALAQIAGLLLKGANTPEKIETARINYYNWDQRIVGSPEKFIDRKKELDNTFNEIAKRNLISEGIPTDTKLHLWNIGEILKHDFGEEEWIVESLISKQGITALSGNPGDFKTWLTTHIALCVSRQSNVFDRFPTSQGGVLIIDEEDNIRLLKKRLELLGAKDTDNIHYLSQCGIKVDVESVRDMIVDIVKEKDIKLVILDSLVRVHQQEENDAGGMAKVFSGLQKILIAGSSILFTHHHRKQQNGQRTNNTGQSMRGSSDILAAIDCHITVEKKSPEEDVLVIRQTKLRQGEVLKSFEVNILKGELGPSGFEYAGGHDERKKKVEEAIEDLVSILSDSEEEMKSRPDIIEALSENFGRDTIDKAIKQAEEECKIEKLSKEELPKNEKKAFYRTSKIYSTAINKHKELPVSLSTTEEGNKEDEELDYNDPASF